MVKQCTYKLKNGTEFNSFAELLNSIDTKIIQDFQSFSDVVYSKFARRDAVKQQLIDLNKEYTPKKRVDSPNSAVAAMINGEPGIIESDVIGISDWIDHPCCQIDGDALITQLSEKDYIQYEIEELSKTMTEEEAIKKANEIVNKHWKIIESDAILLHRMLTSSKINADMSDFEKIEGATDRLGLILTDKIYAEVKHFLKELHIKHSDSNRISNINLRTAIKGFDKDLIGHIDYMFIDKHGNLHIYNFKTTYSNPHNWSIAKQNKYKMQLAFLKQMLANKGIQVKNMSLNIVPIQLQYDDEFKTIQNIKLHPPHNYNLNKFSNPQLNSYFDKAKYFIESNIPEPQGLSKGIQEANKVIKTTFPTLNIKSEGIATSAAEWIRTAPSSGNSATPIIITPIDGIDHAYDLTIYGETIPIKSNKKKENNKEIEEHVIKYLSKLDDNKDFITHAVKEIVESGIKNGYFKFTGNKSIEKILGTHLEAILAPYIERAPKEEPEWTFNDTLIDQNILLFTNKNTGQTDVVTLSHLNLNANVKINNFNNILGAYKSDAGTKTLKSHYGNIETIRTLLLLNSIFPELEFDNAKLGQIKIISTQGHSRIYDINYLTKNYLPEIFKVVKEYNSDLKDVQNNLANASFVNHVDVLLEQYNHIIQNCSEWHKDEYENMGFDELRIADSKSKQIVALESILEQLFVYFKTTDDIKHPSRNNRERAALFELVSNAYKQLTGAYPEYSEMLTWADYEVTPAASVPNKNVNIIVTNFLMTADSIAENTMEQWQKYRPTIMQFYKNIGYTPVQNATIGNQTSQFKNLFDKKTMMFKNPYRTDNNLTAAERNLLKGVLKHFYEIRRTFNPALKEPGKNIEEFITKNPSYLQVPLMRASSASKLQNVDKMKNSWKNLFKVMKDPKKYWDEFAEKLMPEDADTLDKDFEFLSLTNNIERQYTDQKYREGLIERHGSDYFETNVEDILLNVLNKYIQVEKMNKFLIGSKNIIFQLEMLEGITGTDKIIKEEIKYIKDYLKVNVFSRSIMGETGKTITGALSPVKHFVSVINLAGNVVSALRDYQQGFLENFVRTVTKFQTDMSPKYLKDAYAYVVTHGVNNAMNISKLSALCAKYRISNSDLNKITERLRSGRGGVVNADNWAFATLRSPDFVNRMVLFVARCMQDGCWDAMSVKNDILEYNWKKDKRFSLYANNDRSNMKLYNEQRSLYLSKIQEYNEEHPEAPLEYDDNNEIHLPEPYSRKEILSIRNVDRNIYGAYDKSMKSMGEHTAKWWAFGMYTTWMNGIYSNYFMKPQESQIAQRKLEHQRDDNGNLLYFNEEGGLTTEVTEAPYVKGTPMIVQGIAYTLRDMFKICRKNGLTAMKTYMKDNVNAQQNLNKLLSDLLMTLAWYLLIKLAFTSKYEDYKKTMKENPVIENLLVEILYKSSSRAWDSFQGPLNIVNFVGENMNPPVYQIPIKLITDSGKFLFGEKTFGQLVTGNLAIGRSYKDTYNAYLKKEQTKEKKKEKAAKKQ